MEISVAGKNFGGLIPQLEVVGGGADYLVGLVHVVHVPATDIGPDAEGPAVREIPEGINANNRCFLRQEIPRIVNAGILAVDYYKYL